MSQTPVDVTCCLLLVPLPLCSVLSILLPSLALSSSPTLLPATRVQTSGDLLLLLSSLPQVSVNFLLRGTAVFPVMGHWPGDRVFHAYSSVHLARSRGGCDPYFAYMKKLRGSQERRFT